MAQNVIDAHGVLSAPMATHEDNSRTVNLNSNSSYRAVAIDIDFEV